MKIKSSEKYLSAKIEEGLLKLYSYMLFYLGRIVKEPSFTGKPKEANPNYNQTLQEHE